MRINQRPFWNKVYKLAKRSRCQPVADRHLLIDLNLTSLSSKRKVGHEIVFAHFVILFQSLSK